MGHFLIDPWAGGPGMREQTEEASKQHFSMVCFVLVLALTYFRDELS